MLKATKQRPPGQRRGRPPGRKRLALGEIRLDGDCQPRAELDPEVIGEYREAYKAGADMPPVIVFFDGTDYWLADGFHRWHAAKAAGVDKIPCDVRRGTLQDARWYSYSVNQAHGLRRSNADKRRAVIGAFRHPKGVKLSDGQIAAHVGVSDRMVAKYREELTPKVSESAQRTGRDGRTIDTSKIGKGKKAIPQLTAVPVGELRASPVGELRPATSVITAKVTTPLTQTATVVRPNLTVSTISVGGISREANGYVISSGRHRRFRFAANGECCCGRCRPESRNRGRDRAARR